MFNLTLSIVACLQSIVPFRLSGHEVTPSKTLGKWNLLSQKSWESDFPSGHASVQNGSENDSPRESLNLILLVVHAIKKNTIFQITIYIHRFPARPSDDLSVSGPFGSNVCFLCMIFCPIFCAR